MALSKQAMQALIIEQQQSDLSIAAFCREKDINADHFYYHRGQYLKNSNPSAFVRAERSKPEHAVKSDQQCLILHHGKTQLHLPVGTSTVWLSTLVKAIA